MTTMRVEVPDQLAKEMDTLVQEGWFSSGNEIVRLALAEFIKNHRFELAEQFQQEDIAWALEQKK